MEKRWLSLAPNYEFAERLSNFIEPFRKQKRQTWGTSSPDDKITGDLGNVIETT